MTGSLHAHAIAQARTAIARIDAEHPEPDDAVYMLDLCATMGVLQPAKPGHAMHNPANVAKSRLLEAAGLLQEITSDDPSRLSFALTDLGRAAIH